MFDKKYIKRVLLDNVEYIDIYGLAGADPQLYYKLPLNRLSQKYNLYLFAFLRKVEKFLVNKLPFLLHAFVGMTKEDKSVNPYGLALLIQAFVNMSKFDESMIERAVQVELILRKKLIYLNNGRFGVGNPGDSRNIFLPGSAEAILAYVKLYECCKKIKYLEIARGIADGVESDVKIFNNPLGQHFAYGTSDDEGFILNANAIFADALLAIEKHSPDIKKRNLINNLYKSLVAGLNHRRIPYGLNSVSLDPGKSVYDVYHTGFYLRAMHSLAKHFNDLETLNKTEEAFSNQMKDFLSPNGYIINLTSRKTQVDIHGVAEYIRSFKYSNKCVHGYNVITKNIEYVLNNRGTYYYQRGLFNLDIYMPRWGHFSMMLALSELLDV